LSETIDWIVDAIVDLGLAEREILAAQVARWRDRPLDEDATFDEAEDAQGFLAQLQSAGVLDARQLRVLLAILSGGQPATPPADPDDPFVGRRFGDYVAREKLGEGGMGKVYRAARGDRSASDYVVKLFDEADDPETVERIRREAEVLALLAHPNVVRLHDSGEVDGTRYLVLEYVDGPTLQELVDRRGRLPWETATRMVAQIGRALAVAHERGIVHRDVKPQNVLVGRDGAIKLCDFGLAKPSEGTNVRSRAGMILGSPAYIAPEQWGDHEVDHRVDLFALGVVYYLLLTGVTPFRGRTPAEYHLRIREGEYVGVEALVPGVPPGVVAVVGQLLERDRRYRTPSATALLTDLVRLLSGEEPEVPRLEAADASRRCALVGHERVDVGSGPGCVLALESADLAPRHAVIERSGGRGFLIRANPDPGAPTYVGGQRLRDPVLLKPGDRVRFGASSEWTYRAGNLASGRVEEPDSGSIRRIAEAPSRPTRIVPVSGLLAAALEDAAHPLALLCCFEGLHGPTTAAALHRSAQALLAAGVDPDLARRAPRTARALWQQRVQWLTERLFQTTYENLGGDVAAWLAWWSEVRGRHPVQVCASRPHLTARLEVAVPGQEPRTVVLDGATEWTIGRAVESDLTVADVSVSRRHASLFTLASTFAFRDLGSRHGTRLRGERAPAGLLADGDALELGRVLATYRHGLNPDEPPRERVGVDRITFSTLVAARAPQAVACLIDLLDTPACAERARAAATRAGLELSRVETDDLTGPVLDLHRQLALDALPAITRTNQGADPAAWRAWWAEAAAAWPRQVEPHGWSD